MRVGLPISLCLHAGVIFGAGFAFSTIEPLEQGRIVPVELITVDEFTNIRASLEREQPEPEPEIELAPPMQVLTSAENADTESDTPSIAPNEEADVTPPEVQPEPDPSETDEADVEPEKVAEGPAFDLDRISGLIDKSRDTSIVADSQVAQESAEERLVYDDTARQGIGAGNAMTLSELDALNSAMYRCWRKPVDVQDLQKLVVRLHVDMLPGGFIKDVRVIDRAASRRAAPGNPFWDIAEMRAMQAVKKCAPYDFLPADKFEQWETLILNFRPQL